MKSSKLFAIVALTVALSFVMPVFTSSSAQAGKPGDLTILEIAKNDPDNFSILVGALEATGLDAAVDGKRQFTVFAPTNAAFADALATLGITKAQLFADTDALANILKFHVTTGNRPSQSVVNARQIRMFNGDFAYITADAGGVSIANAPIVATDIRASNGTIHVLSAVMLP